VVVPRGAGTANHVDADGRRTKKANAASAERYLSGAVDQRRSVALLEDDDARRSAATGGNQSGREADRTCPDHDDGRSRPRQTMPINGCLGQRVEEDDEQSDDDRLEQRPGTTSGSFEQHVRTVDMIDSHVGVLCVVRRFD